MASRLNQQYETLALDISPRLRLNDNLGLGSDIADINLEAMVYILLPVVFLVSTG